MKKFNLKQLLLCIIGGICVSTFIGFSIIFVYNIASRSEVECVNALISAGQVEEVKELAKNYEEIFDEGLKSSIVDDTEQFGEDFPSKGLLLYRLVNYLGTDTIVNMYVGTVLFGSILGIVIYIIFVQKATGKNLVKELIIALGIELLINYSINLVYRLIINSVLKYSVENKEFDYYVDLLDSSLVDMTIWVFVGIVVIAYIVNIVRQNLITRKMNVELNKK